MEENPQASPEAQRLFSETLIDAVRKENPARAERNRAIKAMIKAGSKGFIVARVSGLSTSSVSRIARNETNRETKKAASRVTLADLKREFNDLRKRFDAYIKRRGRK
jgi:hypothetical protein